MLINMLSNLYNMLSNMSSKFKITWYGMGLKWNNRLSFLS
jgi:hypothetical protein